MIFMKLSEMRSTSLQDLKEQVIQLRSELAKERAVIAGGTRPENPGRIRNLRKTIAKLLTVANERERKGEKLVVVEKQGKASKGKGLIGKVIKRRKRRSGR